MLGFSMPISSIRQRLARYLSFHSFGFDVAILHLHYHSWSRQDPPES